MTAYEMLGLMLKKTVFFFTTVEIYCFHTYTMFAAHCK